MVQVEGLLFFDLEEGPNSGYASPIGFMPLRVMVNIDKSPYAWTNTVYSNDDPPVATQVPVDLGHWRVVVRINGAEIGSLEVNPTVQTGQVLVPITQITCVAGQLFEIYYEPLTNGSPVGLVNPTAVVWWKAVFY